MNGLLLQRSSFSAKFTTASAAAAARARAAVTRIRTPRCDYYNHRKNCLSSFVSRLKPRTGTHHGGGTNIPTLEEAVRFFSVASSDDGRDDVSTPGDERSFLFSPLDRDSSGDEVGGGGGTSRSSTVISSVESVETPSILFGAVPPPQEAQDRPSSSDDEEDDNETAPKFSGPMFANNKNSYLGILKEYYKVNHGISITDDDFDDTQIVSNNGKKNAWTSVFTCPLTKRKYASGHLRNVTPLSNINDDDDLIYYSKKKGSRYAASGRALDAIQFEKVGLVEPRFCKEDPSEVLPESVVNKFQSPVPLEWKVLKDKLRQYYQDEHNLTGFNNFKKQKKVVYHGKQGREVWTSSFICPLTGTKYPAGRIRDAGCITSDRDAGPVFYQKCFNARRAAVARALDVIQFQKEGITEPRFCVEDPSLFSVKPTMQAGSAQDDDSEEESISQEQTGEHIVTKSRSPKRSPSENALSEHIRNEVGSKEPEPTKENDVPQFESAAEFFGGSLKGPEPTMRDESSRPEFDRTSTLFDGGGKQRAKASRESSTTPAFESASDLFGGSLKGPESTIKERSSIPELESASALFDHDPVEKYGEEEEEQEEEDGGFDESDYVISKLPVSVGRPPSHHLLEVASKIGSSTLLSTNPNNSKYNASSIFTKQRSPVPLGVKTGSGEQMAIQTARHWLRTQSGKLSEKLNRIGGVHRLDVSHRIDGGLAQEQSTSSLLVGKTILAGLAAANQATPLDHKQGTIEGLAKEVLQVLWETEDSKPDADAYTFYLKCLDQYPRAAKARAEEIVDAMRSGTSDPKSGRILPKPNRSTINALIQISARVGGTSGRYSKYTDGDFTPDRESFLAVLSSSVYQPQEEFESGGFDFDFAQECIQRMYEMADDTGDTSLQPDTQVYNAPLRWAGGPRLSAESRPYTRCVAWEDYEKMFVKGLRKNVEGDDLRVKEAQDMETWLNRMEEESATNELIAPNIETYEAVIQGWLRTVTRDGLDRAESILERVMPKTGTLLSTLPSNTPRLQTFHPLLAAWYHSGDPDGPSKIVEWIGRCEKLAEAGLLEDVMTDSRIVELKMLAFVMEQDRIIKEMKCDDECKSVNDDVLNAGKECSKVLQRACERLWQDLGSGEFSGQILEVILFSLASRAWDNVAVLAFEANDEELHRQAAEELLNSAALFEQTLHMVVRGETSRGVTLRSQEMSTQLEHLVINMHQYFCTIVEAMTKIEKHLSEEESRVIRRRSLLLMEKLTRVVGESQETISHFSDLQSGKKKKKRILYEDEFSYQTRGGVLFVSSQYAFLWNVVKYLEIVDDDVNAGDIVRLCSLIKHVASRRRESPKIEEAVDKIMAGLLPGYMTYRDEQGNDHDALRNIAQMVQRLGGSISSSRQKRYTGRAVASGATRRRDETQPDDEGKPSGGGGAKLIRREPKLSTSKHTSTSTPQASRMAGTIV